MPVADALQVGLHLTLPPTVVTIDGDEALVERAIANVVDNAVRYNGAGGNVYVTLSVAEDGRRFRLCVVDSGHGVGDEEFRGLTAIRRFRGDEGRIRRPGAPGLGLAVAREVADRFKMQLDLKRPSQGGFEVEFSGAV
jgi:signal transduction histidine kinase